MRRWVIGALVMLVVGITGLFLSFGEGNPLDFGTEPYFEEKTIPADAVQNIQIKSDSLSIDAIKGRSNDIVVRLEGNASSKYLDRFKLTAEQKGDTLYVDGSMDDYFTFGINIVNVKMTVELPEKVWESFEVTNKSGSIFVSDLQGDVMNVTTQSGNIKTELVTVDELVSKVNSGNITLSDLRAKSAELKATSGNIKLNGYTLDKLNFDLNSGSVELRDGTSEVTGELTSGNVRIDAKEIVKSIKLKLNSGDVSIRADKEPESAKITFGTNSGSSRINWSSFNSVEDNDKSLSGTVGSGDEILIDVKTTSGNLRINK
ncbi:MAG: DUF4097 family beta strand repeat-containing protein [Candidatus Pristimantibacillus sp.]